MMDKSGSLPLSRNAIHYSWHQLALRAGIEDFNVKNSSPHYFTVPLYYGFPEQVPYKGKKIVVVPCKDRDWFDLLEQPSQSIDWIQPRDAFPDKGQLPFDYQIPVLFWANSEKRAKIVECAADGTLVFYIDILASTFFLLSRWEEVIQTSRDEHGRFPASTSVAYKQRFLDIPVVDSYGLLLREWFKEIVPGWRPAPSHLRINLTHDIDFVHHFSGPGQFARVSGSTLLRQRNPAEFLKQFKRLYTQLTAPTQDDYFQSIYRLADMSEAHGFFSRFYFMATDANQYQAGYDPSMSWMQKCLKSLRERGHEIGIHPGYYTFGNPEQLIVEKQRLEEALRESIFGGRQHYLRFQVPDTWKHWEKAGLSYDSSMGYADHEGFRCGTCHPYHPYNVELDQEMKIQEIPLIVMDTSLRYYRKLSPLEGKNRVLAIARRCADVGGVFTLLWHNTSFSGDWTEWSLMYQEILNELSKMSTLYKENLGYSNP